MGNIPPVIGRHTGARERIWQRGQWRLADSQRRNGALRELGKRLQRGKRSRGKDRLDSKNSAAILVRLKGVRNPVAV